MNNEPIVLERTYNAPVQAVWSAISSIDEMKKWYFNLTEFKPEVGFEFEFLKNKDGRQYRHMYKVTEVITGKKLAYSWRYEGYPGTSLVTWELFAEGEKTRLKLTHAGLETFQQNNPDFEKRNYADGWAWMLDTQLKDYLGTNISQKQDL